MIIKGKGVIISIPDEIAQRVIRDVENINDNNVKSKDTVKAKEQYH
ncbi:hypothetical protein [Sulfolobus acidocaldarius]|uniref:Uncharacterized protein n=2 Tax=Sulfolobus acidocaldarius TaxID=2285 RepID=M1J4P3_9CREN|nr:hypothetical protein [Sulfolobus acidocaldarius]AGE71929.1 hypothetical protein SacN8_09860 [Sulfolobus acidocaldarius N8]AGE74201.1 hypothetical protein SacRon12I_09880 [Sulfolobus acidocaldarius Ron12/I]